MVWLDFCLLKIRSVPYKRYLFLIRWFLINRYHCDLEYKYKRYWWIVHKLLWSVILLCVIYSFVGLVRWITLE